MNEFFATTKAELCKPMSFVTFTWGCMCFTLGVLIAFGIANVRIEAGLSVPGGRSRGMPGLPFKVGQPTNGSPGRPRNDL